MERIENINRDRVVWCCADYGMTPAALADEVGISASTMEKFMAGELGLTFGQLSAVAKHFGRGVLFFMEEGPVDPGRIHTPQFRTLANQKPELTAPFRRLIERAERQREVYLSLLEELDEEDRPVFEPPPLPAGDARRAAALVRKWLDLGGKNSFDSYRGAVEARPNSHHATASPISSASANTTQLASITVIIPNVPRWPSQAPGPTNT